MVKDARRLHVRVAEGLWLRLVDVEGTLRARSYTDVPEAVLEVADLASASALATPLPPWCSEAF